MKTGIADLPLHTGSCPKWLFEKMVKLGKAISEIIILEYGKDEFLRRISDPFFFQSLACVLGYDWHSSGTTTVTCAALKEGLKSGEMGIAVVGGKGKASVKTQEEIEKLADVFPLATKKIEELKYASRMCAKVDNSALQDGFQLYHHSFIVTEEGKWAVIQQGMNPLNKYARRYHWISEKVESFVVEPHAAIACDFKGKALNMVAKESQDARKACVDLIKDNPIHLKKYFSPLFKYLRMESKHEIELKDCEKIMNSFLKAYEKQPKDFEELLGLKGIGPKSIRALALLSKLIFGVEASWRDPVTFSFAHGGKDGTPYPVNRETYEKSISVLEFAIDQAKLGKTEKIEGLKRLSKVFA